MEDLKNLTKTVIITLRVEEKDGSGCKTEFIRVKVPFGIDTGKILANIRGKIVKKTVSTPKPKDIIGRERLDGY